MNPYTMCNMYNNLYNSYPCGCFKPNINQVNNNYPPKNFSYDWSRVGPMGGLMEPKVIYLPPNSGDIQVNTNIRTTISQKMNGFNIAHPMTPDLMRRINDERLRTTYQSDFCNTDNFLMITDYNNWVYNNNNRARMANMQRNEEEIECRPQPKPPYLGGHEIPGRNRTSTFGASEKNSNGRKRSSQISSRLSRTSRDQKQKSENSHKQKIESRSLKKNNDSIEVEVASDNFEKESESLKNSIESMSSEKNSNDLQENSLKEDNKALNDSKDSEEISEEKKKTEDNINSISSYNSADSCRSKNKTVNDDTYIYLNYSNRRRKYTVDLSNENLDMNILPWLSEYQDTIGGTGDEILKTNLHYYGKLRLLPDYLAHKKKQADMKKNKDKKLN